MVKNNIFLVALLASFTAPVFASNFLPKQCPLGENGKLIGAVVAFDYASSKFTNLSRAIEFHGTNNPASTVVVDASNNNSSVVDSKSLVQKINDSSVTVDFNLFGKKAGVTVNPVSLALKTAATYALIKGAQEVVGLVTNK